MTQSQEEAAQQTRTNNQISFEALLKKVGVKTQADLKQMLELTRWSVFAETYFQAPPDLDGAREETEDNRLKLDTWQKKVLDKVQHIWYNRDKEGVKRLVLVVAPRGYGKSIVVSVLNAILLVIGSNTTAVFSPSESQSETLIAKTKYFIETSQFKKRVLARGETVAGMQKIYTGALSIGMKTGSFTVGYSNNEKTMRGGHFGACLIDEYARMSSHTVKAGIMPMTRRSKGPVIAITTPFGRYGPAWEAYENENNAWEVIKVDPFESNFMTQDRLEEELRAYGGDMELAKQELMAEFISDEKAVIKDAWYEYLYEEEYQNFEKYHPAHKYHMSLDFGWDSNRAVMMIGHWHKNVENKEFIKVDMIKSWLSPDPDQLQSEIIRYLKQYRVRLIVPDGASVGVETLIRLKKRIRKEGLPARIYSSDKSGKKLGFITTGGSGEHSKTNLVSEAVERLSRYEVRLPIHDKVKGEEVYELEKEMKAFAYERTAAGSSMKFGRGVTDEPDDRVLCMFYLLFSFSQQTVGETVYGVIANRDNPVKKIAYGVVNGNGRGQLSWKDIRSGQTLSRKFTQGKRWGR
jgi:hypothetical protein